MVRGLLHLVASVFRIVPVVVAGVGVCNLAAELFTHLCRQSELYAPVKCAAAVCVVVVPGCVVSVSYDRVVYGHVVCGQFKVAFGAEELFVSDLEGVRCLRIEGDLFIPLLHRVESGCLRNAEAVRVAQVYVRIGLRTVA